MLWDHVIISCFLSFNSMRAFLRFRNSAVSSTKIVLQRNKAKWNVIAENYLFSENHIWFPLHLVCSKHYDIWDIFSGHKSQWSWVNETWMSSEMCFGRQKHDSNCERASNIHIFLSLLLSFLCPLFYLLLGRCERVQIDDAVRKMRTCICQDESDDTFFSEVCSSGTSNRFMTLSTHQRFQIFSSTSNSLTTNKTFNTCYPLEKCVYRGFFIIIYLWESVSVYLKVANVIWNTTNVKKLGQK